MRRNFYAGKIVGEKLYFSMMYTDALCCMNLANMHYKVIKRFNINDGIKIYHKACHLYDNKLYFIPKESKNIYIYDLLNNQMDLISLRIKNVSVPCDGVFYNNHFWIFPSTRDDDLIVIDLDTKKIEIIEKFRMDFNENAFKSTSPLIFHRIAQVDNIVWLPIFKSKKLISYDMEKGKMEAYDVCENITSAFNGIECLWLGTVEENRILKWNYNEKRIEDVMQTNMIAVDKTGPSGIYEYGNLLVIVPGYGDEIHIINTLERSDSLVFKVNQAKNDYEPFFVHSELNNQKLYVFPYSNEKMIIIDLCTCKANAFSLVSESEISRYISLENNKEIIFENNRFFLNDFIAGL